MAAAGPGLWCKIQAPPPPALTENPPGEGIGEAPTPNWHSDPGGSPCTESRVGAAYTNVTFPCASGNKVSELPAPRPLGENEPRSACGLAFPQLLHGLMPAVKMSGQTNGCPSAVINCTVSETVWPSASVRSGAVVGLTRTS